MRHETIAIEGLEHEAAEHARWAALDDAPRRQPRADMPEWVRFAIFYALVFAVLGGWVSALRTLIDILRASGVLQ